MPRFADLTVSALLDALASSTPTPGGGTAAAIAGAMGTSLLAMVAGLPRTRNNTDEERAVLAGVRDALQPMSARLAALADADADAFDEVMAAYKLPKGTDDEKAARSTAIQQGLRGATAVPLDTMRVVAAALAQATLVARLGNRSAVSDIGVALGLLDAAAAGAAMNVRTNLDSVKDHAFVRETVASLEQTASTVASDLADARARLAA
jgi:methenyltetrahydrofolate cyclohydrolase